MKRTGIFGNPLAFMLGTIWIAIWGCNPHNIESQTEERSNLNQGKSDSAYDHFSPSIPWDGPKSIKLETNPRFADALKRGFHDFNGDGLQDLIELHNLPTLDQILSFNAGSLFDYNGRVFPGTRQNGILVFGNAVNGGRQINIPIKLQEIAVKVMRDIFREKILAMGSWASQYLSQVDRLIRIENIKGSKPKFDTADLNGDGLADVVVSNFAYANIQVLESLRALRPEAMIFAGAVNQGNYTFHAMPLAFKVQNENKSFGEMLFDSYLSDGTGEMIDEKDYHMDWADVNGDKKEDFLLFKKNWGEIIVYCWINNTPTGASSIVLANKPQQWRQAKFLSGRVLDGFAPGTRSADEIDTEDINGDGYADIVIFDEWELPIIGGWNPWNSMRFRVAINQWPKYRRLSFNPHKDFETTEKDTSWWNGPWPGNTLFRKRDFFDINGDGCADYAHIGVDDAFMQHFAWRSNTIMTYNLVDCQKAKELSR